MAELVVNSFLQLMDRVISVMLSGKQKALK